MTKLPVQNTTLLQFQKITDPRGSLSFCESGKNIPFDIKRIFWVYGTPKDVVRGHHAHRRSSQVHICQNGSARIHLEDGHQHSDIVLDNPASGLLIGPLVWHSFTLSQGATLFVVTSDFYQEDDYIRDHDEFLRLAELRFQTLAS